ncbi:MAG: class I SAM-dependent methyltransferase [Thermoleophilaceae bacterium]|nr:class I SAM-dependent methyltransferase [Thermoleophilaceae bacterium]
MVPRGLVRLDRWERIYGIPWVRRAIVRHFDRAYYYAGEQTIFDTRWMGYQTIKYPADMWIYQELISELRPAVVLETGTWQGGSALFLATVLDALGEGRVISVDITHSDDLPRHDRLSYLTGSSVDPAVVAAVKSEIGAESRVLVILDSDHSRDHVLGEMDAYADLVPLGGYLIVEDTNVNGHPVRPDFGPGPMEAVDAFLAGRSDFEVDRYRERLLSTANPRGYLRRVA